jgi:predicted O-methyltransferase YrrM
VSDRQTEPENSAAFRRSLRRSAPAIELDAIHTRGCVVLPSREVLLEHLPKGGIVAEIGVAEGEFSRAILQRNAPRQLHLIDMWDTDRYRRGLEAIRQDHAARISDGSVVIHQGRSLDRLAEFADASLDWVYVDTDHSYALTLAELRLAATKVRPHGLIAGHDYCTGNVITPWPYGVVEACHQFCAEDHWGFTFLALEARGRMSFALSRLSAEPSGTRP